MGNSIRGVTDRSESWTNAKLDEAWRRCAATLPEPARDNLAVTFHGPSDDRPWVATSWMGDGASPEWGPEGWGDTPVTALMALERAQAAQAGWWHITRDDPDGRGPG